jgi:hypothetical protein
MKRGRPFVVEWQESAGGLFARYHQEKNVHRRTRLQALWRPPKHQEGACTNG